MVSILCVYDNATPKNWRKQIGPISYPVNPERRKERMPELLTKIPEENKKEAESALTVYVHGRYDRSRHFRLHAF